MSCLCRLLKQCSGDAVMALFFSIGCRLLAWAKLGSKVNAGPFPCPNLSKPGTMCPVWRSFRTQGQRTQSAHALPARLAQARGRQPNANKNVLSASPTMLAAESQSV
jgi:hypothetical protein